MENVNKKFLPLAVVGVVLLLGLGAFAVLNMNKGALPGSVSEKVSSGQNSIKDLLSSGSSQECTFKDNESGNEGIVYVAGGKMKGNFTTNVEGQSAVSNVIVNENVMYSWMEGQTTGYRFAFDPEDVEEARQEAEQGSVNLNEEVDMSCKPWMGGSNEFDPPSDVNFQEFSVPTSGAQMPNASNCSACDYLSGESKTQCLQALNC
jgi:hypothetical protein